MWSILNGTIVNALTVTLGSTGGLLVGKDIPDRYQKGILTALGLVTIWLGVDSSVFEFRDAVAANRPEGAAGQTYGARLALVVVGCLLIGGIIGTGLRLHERVHNLGKVLHDKFGAGDAKSFAEGFLSASVIFCVGPLTLLGCIANGSKGDPSLLYIKSLMDGFCSLALASSLGVGVGFSVITIVVFQGGLSLASATASGVLTGLEIQMMSVVGGMLLLATALMLLEIKPIPVADYLPGIFLPPLAIRLIEAIQPGFIVIQ